MSESSTHIKGNFNPLPDKHPSSYCLSTPPDPKGLLVLAHGAGAGMDHPNMVAISQAMQGVGLAVFRYNFLYMERGGGRESQKISLSTIEAAAAFAQSLEPRLPLLLGGHSYGGRMSSHVAAGPHDLSLKAMIYFAFPLHAPGKASKERARHLKTIEIPQLFLSGSRDTFSTGNLLEEVVEEIGPKAKLHRIHTADHSYKILKRSRPEGEGVFEEMSRITKDWLEQI